MTLKTKPLEEELIKADAADRSHQRSLTIGSYLLDRLKAFGVEHIFGVPGDYILRFDKLIEEHEVKFINATRENTAGYMADAYARIRGLGVACITYGVGINITNALSQAFVENSPLVVISGSPGKKDFRHGVLLHHLINQSNEESSDKTQLEIFKQVTIGQAVLDNPASAKEEIDRVIKLCLETKKPVYIEIPRDMIDSPLIPSLKTELYLKPKSDEKALQEAIHELEEILKQCKQPLIWIGHEIQRYQLALPLLQFAEKYRIPIVSSLLGKSTISEHHPLFMGVFQGEMSRPEVADYVNCSDCVFMVGVLLTDVETGIFTAQLEHEHQVAASTESIKIDHHHYKNINFSEFINKMAESNLNLRFKSPYPASIDRVIPHFKPSHQTKTTVNRVFECIQQHLKQDHVVLADVGDALFASADLILGQDAFLASACFGSLGFAIPGGLGAQIANPKRRVIAIVGDGACQMSAMELSTAVRYHLDPIVIVLNNHGFGTERHIIEGGFNDVQDWNYAEIPSLLKGGVGIRATTEEEFDQALKKALSERGTFYLIEVELQKTDISSAMLRFEKALKKPG